MFEVLVLIMTVTVLNGHDWWGSSLDYCCPSWSLPLIVKYLGEDATIEMFFKTFLEDYQR